MVAALTVLIVGCEQALDETGYLQRAESSLEAGDRRAAIIDLKALLSGKPDSAAGRLLLADVYIQSGDFDLASKELDRALAAAAEPSEVLPRQAYIWRRLGQGEQVLGLDVSQLPPGAAAAILVQQASMMMAGGWLDDADEMLGEAGLLDADSAFLETERARLSAVRGDRVAAREALEQITRAGGNADAWSLLGGLEKREGKLESAIAAYSGAIKLRPNYYSDVVERAFLYLQTGQVEAAEQDLARMARRYPDFYLVSYGLGVLHKLRDEPQLAIESLQKAIGANPEFGPALLILGALQLEQGALPQAIQNLSKFNALLPGTYDGQAMLGAAYAAAGEIESAEPMLRSAVALQPESLPALVQLAELLVKAGEFEESRELVQRAIALKPGEPQLHQMLGASFLMSGQPEMAKEQFALAAEFSDGNISGYINLVRYYAAAGNEEEAMQLASSLIAQYPESPDALVVLGGVYLLQADNANAADTYQKAIKFDPAHAEARHQLAVMAIQEGDYEAAEGHYRAVLEVAPDSVKAKLMIAELERYRGDANSREGLLEAAVSEHPEDTAARLALALYQMEVGELSQAMLSLGEISGAPANEEPVRFVRAQALLANGDFKLALKELEALLKSQADNPRYLYLAGRSSEGMGELEQAQAFYTKAAAQDESFLSPRIYLHRLFILRHDNDRAKSTREEAERLGADESYLLGMEIDEALAMGDIATAASLARKLQGKYPSTEHISILATIQWRSGGREEAIASLEAWLKKSPEDRAARVMLAEYLLGTGEEQRSQALYEQEVATGGASPRSLNNLAFLLLESDPPRALELASQAVEQAPDSADIIDTRAWAEHANGQKQQALRTSNRALLLSPDSAELKWSNVQFLLSMEMREEAAASLAELLEQHEQFPGREEAEQQYSRLK